MDRELRLADGVGSSGPGVLSALPKIRVHGTSGRIAFLRVSLAGFEQDFVEAAKLLSGQRLLEIRRQIWELLAVVTSAGFVKDLAQAIHVGRRAARALGREIAPGADQRCCMSNVRH